MGAVLRSKLLWILELLGMFLWSLQLRGDGMWLQRVKLEYSSRKELYDGFHGYECGHCGKYNRNPMLHYLVLSGDRLSYQRGHQSPSLKAATSSPAEKTGALSLSCTRPQTWCYGCKGSTSASLTRQNYLLQLQHTWWYWATHLTTPPAG